MGAAIEIPPGERQKLLSQPGVSEEYQLQVSGSDIFLSHRASRVREEGDRVRPGDRVRVSNLDGKPLYAKNPASSSSNARVDVSEASFALNFFPRAVQASVQTDDTNEAAPRTDNFVAREANGIDVSGAAETETVSVPDRADFVQVFCDTGGNSVTVDVEYGTSGGPYVGPTFTGSGAGAVAVRTAVFNPEARLTFSGAATNLDYRIYAR
jgi:hypothetical protein